jgi:hypothetical protein
MTNSRSTRQSDSPDGAPGTSGASDAAASAASTPEPGASTAPPSPLSFGGELTNEQLAKLGEARGMRVLTQVPDGPPEGLGGTYELTAYSWDEPVLVARRDPSTGALVETSHLVRHRKGDLVTLSDREARRLLAADAVAVPGVREAVRLAQLEQAVKAQEAAVRASKRNKATEAFGDGLTDVQRAMAEEELRRAVGPVNAPSAAPSSDDDDEDTTS